MKLKNIPTTVLSLTLATASITEAQSLLIFDNGAGDSLWSNSSNWSADNVADTTSEYARIQGNPIVDQNFTTNRLQNAFGSGNLTTSSSNGSVLTLDLNISGSGNAITNVSGNAGSNLQFSGNVRINNTGGGISYLAYANSSSNAITFTETSVLELSTRVETSTGTSVATSGSLAFNGSIIGGSAGVSNLRIGAYDGNITFGPTADNSAYAGDILFLENTSVISNTSVVGGFLSTGSKVQVNAGGGNLTLNGADSMRGNLVVGGTDVTFDVNVNANQPNLGFLNPNGTNAVLNLTLSPTVTELYFADSSSYNWGTGAVVLTGFQEGVIRFGNDANGLTPDQLDAINGGIYSLSPQGYLTSIPEPSVYGLYFATGSLLMALVRRRK